MEDTFFVKGLTVQNSSRVKSSKLTSNEIVSATPSRVPQIAAIKDKSIEVAANNLTVSPVTVNEATTKITSFDDSILHIAPDQHRNATVTPFTTRYIAVGKPTPTVASISVDVDALKTNTIENSPSKIDSDKFDPIQADVLQNNTPKISFSSSISPEQFFSVHNSTPEIINALNIGLGEIQSTEVDSTQIISNGIAEVQPIISEVSDSSIVEPENFLVFKQWFIDHAFAPQSSVNVFNTLNTNCKGERPFAPTQT
jgi:hypothetical protein